MEQRKCPMEHNYHRPLVEFKIRAQGHHLEKNILLLFLSYLFKHSHVGSISSRGLPEGGKPGEQSSSGDGPRRLAGCSRPVGPLRRGRAATPGKGVEGGRAPGLALRGRPDGPEREGRPERRRPELRPRPRIRAGLSRACGGGGGGGSTHRAPDAARPAC